MPRSTVLYWEDQLFVPKVTIPVFLLDDNPSKNREMKVTKRSHRLKPTGKLDLYLRDGKLVLGIIVEVLKQDQYKIWQELGSTTVPIDSIELPPEVEY